MSQIDLQWFAAEDEGKTEEPSSIKLDRARKEGRVAKSQELNSAIALLLSTITLIILGKWIFEQCLEIYIFFFSRAGTEEFFNPANGAVFLSYFLKIVLPIAVVGVIGAVSGNLIQNRGFIFSFKPITPKFSNIIPHIGQYLKKTMFSKTGLFNVAKSIGKVAIIAAVGFNMIKGDLPELLAIIQERGSMAGCLGMIASMGAKILIFAALFFIAISIPDYFVQRHEFMEQMKMTKEEVKQEFKEQEGDPEVKSHLEQAKRELLRRSIPKAVKESDVVITNPTHFAVALKYDPAVKDAPVVNAKGEDNLAQEIKKIARENNVPIVENKPLARGLYAETKIGDIIPEVYFKAISVVYAQLEKFKKK
ncbi:MAG: EscU/YscU/HrcU family type III secretion system export apparatus switch protein [Treponema sp.]|nr:EscU/YscU/HrcU family type III secretion system export apparatus switch protein [Candidatus Treponema merdequi]